MLFFRQVPVIIYKQFTQPYPNRNHYGAMVVTSKNVSLRFLYHVIPQAVPHLWALYSAFVYSWLWSLKNAFLRNIEGRECVLGTILVAG